MRKPYPVSNDLRAAGLRFKANFSSQIQSATQRWETIGSPTFSDDGITIGSSDSIYQNLPDPNLFSQDSLEGWSVVIDITPDFDLDSGTSRYLVSGKGSGDSTIEHLVGLTGSNALVLYAGGTYVGSVSYATLLSYWNASSKNTLVVSALSGDSNIWLNGIQVMTSNSTAWTGSQIDQLIVGQYGTAGVIHRFEVYKGACTAKDEPYLRNGTLISSLGTQESIITLPLERDYNNGSLQVTPAVGKLGGEVLMGDDGLTPADFPTKDPAVKRGYIFAGSDSLTILNNSLLTPSSGGSDSGRTWAFVHKQTDDTLAYDYLGIKGFVTGTDREYLLRTYGHRADFVIYDADGDYLRVYGDNAIRKDEIQSIIYIYRGTEVVSGLEIYVDGIRADDTTFSSGTYNSITNLGANLTVCYSTTGLLSTMRVYEFDLSPMQVKALHVRMMSEVVR